MPRKSIFSKLISRKITKSMTMQSVYFYAPRRKKTELCNSKKKGEDTNAGDKHFSLFPSRSRSIFSTFSDKIYNFSHILTVFCKCFQFG